MANRDSGYKQVSGGNVAVDFAYGNFPAQTNDDRASSPSFNATGGTRGSTVTEYQSAVVTAASASGGVVTYTASNAFVAGQIVTITGLSTTAFNLAGVTIGTASSTQFTVTNAATGTAVTGASALAEVIIQTIPGLGADYGYTTTTDISSAQIGDADISKAVNNAGTTYTVTVGAGGAASTSARNNGNNSVFDTITANGGGCGGSSQPGGNGANGGSGGTGSGYQASIDDVTYYNLPKTFGSLTASSQTIYIKDN